MVKVHGLFVCQIDHNSSIDNDFVLKYFLSIELLGNLNVISLLEFQTFVIVTSISVSTDATAKIEEPPSIYVEYG